MGWICCGLLLGGIACAAFAVAVFWLLSPTGHIDYECLECPRCSREMRYRIRLPKKIRCSCGNIMPVPPPVPSKRMRHVSCPGCSETIHVSPISKPRRLRCRCGNVADIP